MSDTTPVGILCIAIGCVIGVPAAWWIWNGKQSVTWPSVTGRVLFSEIADAAFSNSDSAAHPGSVLYRLKVRYEFEVDGRRVDGSRLFFGDFWWGWQRSRGSVEAQARQYAPGARVTVFYHPKRPARCTLTTGIDGQLAWVNLLLGIVILYCGLGVFLGWVKVV